MSDEMQILTKNGYSLDLQSSGDRFASGHNRADMINGTGASWKAVTQDPRLIITAQTLLDNTVYFTKIYIPSSLTITGVVYYQVASGVFTADNNNRVGLYKLDSTSFSTAKLVASSANNTSLWKGTANSYVSEPFSSTYSADEGLYAIGILYCNSAQTTAPTIGVAAGSNPLSQIKGLYGNAMFGTTPWTGQGSTPNPAVSDIPKGVSGYQFGGTMSSNDIWLGLY